MTRKWPVILLFLDENVPNSVGQCFLDAGHKIFHLRDILPTGSPDPIVCIAAEANNAILVGFDKDMKALAKRRGIGRRAFKALSLIKLSCREPRSAARIKSAMSLIEHEWNYSLVSTDRRIFIEIGDLAISTKR